MTRITILKNYCDYHNKLSIPHLVSYAAPVLHKACMLCMAAHHISYRQHLKGAYSDEKTNHDDRNGDRGFFVLASCPELKLQSKEATVLPAETVKTQPE